MDAASPMAVDKAPPTQQEQETATDHWRDALGRDKRGYVAPPTAYSPRASAEEDPLLDSAREFEAKLQALRFVRARLTFQGNGRADNDRMRIETRMVLSQEEEEENDAAMLMGNQQHQQDADNEERNGIDALAGLELLLFAFFSPRELVQLSGVCNEWKRLARHDLCWAPLLFTPAERYPMRELLGLSVCVPAIQVYMVFHRSKLTQITASIVDSRTEAAFRRRRRADALAAAVGLDRHRQLRAGRHAAQLNNQPMLPNPEPAERDLLPQEPLAAMPLLRSLESIHLVTAASGFQRSSDVQNADLADLHWGEDIAQLINADRVHSEIYEAMLHADPLHRVTLRSWIMSSTAQTCRRVLPSLLRQMLLAVEALEQSELYVDNISLDTVLVHQSAAPTPQARADADDEDAPMHTAQEISSINAQRTPAPLLQLFCGVMQATAAPALDLMEDAEDADDADELDDIVAGVAPAPLQPQQRQRQFELAFRRARMVARMMGAPTRNRRDCVNSVLRCAVAVGIMDPLASTKQIALTLLQHRHHLPRGLVAFLEYAIYMGATHSLTATQLLRHSFVVCPGDQGEIVPERVYSMTNVRTVEDYEQQILAWYREPHRFQGRNDMDHEPHWPLQQRATARQQCAMQPRSKIGEMFFQNAQKESNLLTERFVSMVVPATASTSWVRTLAQTQGAALQRVDLSNVDMSTSVLLNELQYLPCLTHLRLPRKILWHENMESFIRALACTDLLKSLRVMDTDVRIAMDRMEQAYVSQIDMISYLLQKSRPSDKAFS